MQPLSPASIAGSIYDSASVAASRQPARPTQAPVRDSTGSDVTIVLAAQPTKSLWASQVTIARGPWNRYAGQALQGAPAHHLLSVALVSALHSIGGKRIAHIRKLNGNQYPRVTVLTDDAGFVAGVRRFVNGERVDGRFRAGKNLFRALTEQLHKHRPTVEVIDADARLGMLTSWATLAVITPRETGFIDSLFAPDAVSSTV